MSGAINFGKGSKRRIRQIRWKRFDIVIAILLVLAVTALIAWLALLLARNNYDVGFQVTSPTNGLLAPTRLICPSRVYPCSTLRT